MNDTLSESAASGLIFQGERASAGPVGRARVGPNVEARALLVVKPLQVYVTERAFSDASAGHERE